MGMAHNRRSYCVDVLVVSIKYVLDIVDTDHAGLRSDLYSLECGPKGLEDISRLLSLAERLVERGHSDEAILRILGRDSVWAFGQLRQG